MPKANKALFMNQAFTAYHKEVVKVVEVVEYLFDNFGEPMVLIDDGTADSRGLLARPLSQVFIFTS